MKYIGRIARIYLILALAATASISPVIYLPLAVVLLFLQVYFLFASVNPNIKTSTTLITIFVLPLALYKTLGYLPSAFIITPAILLLDSDIKESARIYMPHNLNKRRRPTMMAIALIGATALIFTMSFILANRTLLYSSSLLIIYYLSIIILIVWKIPQSPLETTVTRIRVVAGNKSEADMRLNITSKLSLILLVKATQPWIHLSPAGLRIAEHLTDYRISITPPLSGPNRPELKVLITDPWGFTEIMQTLEPLDIHVIPRAKYAAWLAKKYLEQTSFSISTKSSSITMTEKLKGATRGIEYKESRPYQPGDRLKDIDWKHSIKLHELITKDYLAGSERVALIAANMDAQDQEQADSIAFKLITSALTMALEGIPTGLAIYNHSGPIEVTKPENARYAIIRALNLVQQISIYKSMNRYLSPPDMSRIRRIISQLKKLESEPAQRLSAILSTESDSLHKSSINHPATLAINKAARYLLPPALIAVISLSADDTEAFAVTLDELKRKGYDHIHV